MEYGIETLKLIKEYYECKKQMTLLLCDERELNSLKIKISKLEGIFKLKGIKDIDEDILVNRYNKLKEEVNDCKENISDIEFLLKITRDFMVKHELNSEMKNDVVRVSKIKEEFELLEIILKLANIDVESKKSIRK